MLTRAAGRASTAREDGGAGGSRAAVAKEWEGGGGGGGSGGGGVREARGPHPSRPVASAPTMALKIQLLTDASGAPAQMPLLDKRHLRLAIDASEGAPVSGCRFSVYSSVTCFTSTKVQILTRCSTRGGTHINLPPLPPHPHRPQPLGHCWHYRH